ncbi:MAG: lyase family protein, partial [Candidatus Dormibacteria bacterium]
LIDGDLTVAVEKACTEVVEGALDEWFVVDIFQSGSGTSTNMNANEVIASRANQHLGGRPGDRAPVHPNDHVNLGQSSNDVIPTALHLATGLAIHEQLLPALTALEGSLRRRSQALWPVIKSGRTHLQDATPIRLGQELLGHAGQMELAGRRCRQAATELQELALGGTAVGTGMATHPEFAERVVGRLRAVTGIPLRETDNHFRAQSNLDIAVSASGALRATALSLHKVAGDVRWLASGPRTGLAEISVPAVQPGSSIMPGKVNPVIAESASMVAAQVVGNDASIAFAGAAGSRLQLNTMMPVIALNLLQSVELLATASVNLAERCIDGIEATPRGPALLERNLSLCTALMPRIGYDAAAAIADEAHRTGRTVREVAGGRLDLSDAELDVLLDPSGMVQPGR